ncbi:MAG: hypothetical protein P8Y47_10855, partial [Alphaproteobacteria bacterium]
DDPLVPQETRIITCDLSKSDAPDWSSYDIGTTTRFYCCPVSKPAEGWLFATGMGEVCFCADDKIVWEDNISDQPKNFTFSLKCIHNGYAYAVGPKRKVYKRESPGNWIKLDKGFKFSGSSTSMGFRDIDGFDESEIYACGGDADLWRFNGDSWNQITLPTDEYFNHVCCGKDGLAYITTSATRYIFCGRDDQWFEIEKSDKFNEILGSITWYNDVLLLSTTKQIYEVNRSGFTPFDMTGCNIKSFSQMTSNSDILMLTSDSEVALYDGASWLHIT